MMDYLDLWELATGPDATQEDIDALGDLIQFSSAFKWNGEYWSAGASHRDTDDSIKVYPVYKETEPDEFEVVRYELR